TIGPTGARHWNEMPVEARSSLALHALKSWNTLPTSKNHEMRVESLSSLTNGVGKMISADATVLNAPPIGTRQFLSVAGQVGVYWTRGPSVLSRKPRTAVTPPAKKFLKNGSTSRSAGRSVGAVAALSGVRQTSP